MEKVRPWCGQPSDRGRLRNRTEQISDLPSRVVVEFVLEAGATGRALDFAIGRSRVQILREATLRTNLGQNVYTYVPLSTRSIGAATRRAPRGRFPAAGDNERRR